VGVEVHGPDWSVVLRGDPLGYVDGVDRIPLREDVSSAVVAHLARVRGEAMTSGVAPNTGTLTIVVDTGQTTIEVAVRGPCPETRDLLWIGGPTVGELCVAAEPLLAFQVAVRAIAAAPLDALEPRPVTGSVEVVTLATGARLLWQGGAVVVTDVGGTTYIADRDAARNVMTALTDPARPYRLPTPRPQAKAKIVVGADVLELLGEGTLARPGSSVGFQRDPEGFAPLRWSADRLRDRLVWRAEAAMVTGITVMDGGTARGVAIDEPWAKAVADAVSELRVEGFLTDVGRLTRTIEVTYAPAPAQGATALVHRIELGTGGPPRQGCRARADGQGVQLSEELCRLLAQ